MRDLGGSSMSIECLAWTWRLNLKSGAKLVLLALADHADHTGICWPGMTGIAKKCNMSRSTVITHINQLCKMELIEKKFRYDAKGHRSSNMYKLKIGLSTELLRSDSDGVSPNLRRGVVQNSDLNHHIEPSIIHHKHKVSSGELSSLEKGELEILDSRSSVPVTKKELQPDVQAIFDYWKEKLGHPRARLDSKRKGIIKRALQLGYSANDLKLAIEGCSCSPFHMGQNGQSTRYDSIKLILRDCEQIDQFMSKATDIKSKASAVYVASNSILQGVW